MGNAAERLAGAPISWGVCEVPGWGAMLPPKRVLSEMRDLGLRATELGPVGYLGDDPQSIRRLLDRFSLAAVGGFVPLVLHDPAARSAAERDALRAAQLLQGAGAAFFVTAIVVDAQWSPPFRLNGAQWDAVAAGLGRVDEICAAHGLRQVVHPHVGTLVESGDDIAELSSKADVRWCLDTGHLSIGGVDPVRFATDHAERVDLVHLKDVDLALARRVRGRELSLLEGTRAGLFRSLGEGDVNVGAAVEALEQGGYAGWYVLEQDTTIGEDAAAEATPAADVQVSIDYLRKL